MDAELEAARQAIPLAGEGDHSEIRFKFAFELLHVALVIDALVKTAAEFGRDGLDGDAFAGDGGEATLKLGRAGVGQGRELRRAPPGGEERIERQRGQRHARDPRRAARQTARDSVSISSSVMPNVDGRPSIVMAAESPTSSMSTPARSANVAVG